MNITDVYERDGIGRIHKLAKAVGISPDYLYQLAIRYKGKRPSPELAVRLIQADRRLTLKDVYAHLGDHPDRARWKGEPPEPIERAQAERTMNRKKNNVVMPSAAFTDRTLSATDLRLLGILYSCLTKRKDEDVWPGFKELGLRIGYSRPTLSKSVAELEAKGWLTLHRSQNIFELHAPK